MDRGAIRHRSALSVRDIIADKVAPSKLLNKTFLNYMPNTRDNTKCILNWTAVSAKKTYLDEVQRLNRGKLDPCKYAKPEKWSDTMSSVQ